MPQTFGSLLKQLRKRNGMTQHDLAAATGYSRSLIGALERDDRLPDLEAVVQSYLPALGLQDEPRLAAQLVELAALTRGERPPASLTLRRERRVVMSVESDEATPHVPHPPTALVGRKQVINHLCNRLQGHQGRILTLVGPPGVGKTSLALAVGADLQGLYSDGACFVPLAPLNDPALVASSLVTALQVPESSAKPPRTRLIEHLRRKELLLILDNFEQLILPAGSDDEASGGPGVRLVADLVAECAGLRVLVTSRERLHLRAEQRFNVPPLDLAPAVDLFVQRAQAVNPDFERSQHNQATLEAICQQLDCLPLAIELCAAQVDLRSLAQLQTQLQTHRLDLLVAGSYDLPPRQRTLRAAISYSYTLLNQAERTLLRSLGVFMGGFTLEAAAAVAGDRLATPVPATLHRLIGKSLVRVETTPTGEPRFWLLETIREFALEQAHAHGEAADLGQRHYHFYLQYFRTGDSHLRDPEALTWIARLKPELNNLRAALQWTFDEARYEDMTWLSIACEWFQFLLGQWQEKGYWLAQLLPYRQLLPADLHLAVLIMVHAIGRAVEAFQPLSRWQAEMLHLLEICPLPHLHSAVWHFMAGQAPNFAEEVAARERAIVAARQAYAEPALGPEYGLFADCDFLLSSQLWSYGSTLAERGAFAQAQPLLRESREILRRRGSRYEVADSLGTSGLLAFMQGDLAEAQTYLAESMTIAKPYNYQEMLGLWQPLLGLVRLYQGDVLEATRLLNESLQVCLDLNDKNFLARIYAYQVELALAQGELDQADQALAQSLACNPGLSRISVYALQRLWVAARLVAAQRQFQQAATLFGVAEQVHSQMQHAVTGSIRDMADAALATVQAELSSDEFAAAFAAGQGLSLDEAFVTVLASGDKSIYPAS